MLPATQQKERPSVPQLYRFSYTGRYSCSVIIKITSYFHMSADYIFVHYNGRLPLRQPIACWLRTSVLVVEDSPFRGFPADFRFLYRG
nr:MAG TPA: hypothetical protein [Caudoviricetes sp.]